MKAIITGATGMVGIAITKQLLNSDNQVVALVRPNSKNINRLPNSKNLEILQCDITDLSKIKNLTADVFFHVAWEGVYGRDRDDVLIQKRNIDTTFDAISLAGRSKCKKFVFAGSQAELGKQNLPIGCNNIATPSMSYGIAKLTCNTLGKQYANSLGLEYNSGRILSTYGINDTPTTLISSLITKLLNNETMQLSDCLHTWDYIYIDDVAKAFIEIAQHGVNGKLYPIGSGQSRQLKHFVQIIESKIGLGKVLYGKPIAENCVNYLCADIGELTQDTGFIPQIAFEEGIERTINWIKGKEENE